MWENVPDKGASKATASGPRFFRYGDVPFPAKGCILRFTGEPSKPERTSIADAVFEAPVTVQYLNADGTLGATVERLFTANVRAASDFKAHGMTGQPFAGTTWLLKDTNASGSPRMWSAVRVVA